MKLGRMIGVGWIFEVISIALIFAFRSFSTVHYPVVHHCFTQALSIYLFSFLNPSSGHRSTDLVAIHFQDQREEASKLKRIF